jgi:uncharacterized protein
VYQRILSLPNLLKKRSFFLFGPRATGKTTLVRQTLKNATIYDLLEGSTFSRLLKEPEIIEQENDAQKIIVIDEVQKMPSILDEVQRLIVKRKQRFLLTGSSARKLKRGGANLLAGRAFEAKLLPLCSTEIPHFDLLSYLNTTGLPEFYKKNLAQEFLEAYVGIYLKEEIQAESLVRNLLGFSRFLSVMALSNGEEVNYASIASDTGVPVRTLEGYLSILNDTLVGFSIPPFLQTKKRKAITRSKYWLFDIGVVNCLTKRGKIAIGSELFGKSFEHFIALEIRAWLSYTRKTTEIFYWRSTSKFEVDFIIGNQYAIEIKSTDHVMSKHLKGLRALKEEGLIEKYCVVSLDPNYRKTNDGIEIFPWKMWIKKMWLIK